MTVRKSNTGNKSETRFLTQEEVDELIKSCLVPLTRQLRDLTRLIRVMSTAHRTNFPPGQLQVLILAHPVLRPTSDDVFASRFLWHHFLGSLFWCVIQQTEWIVLNVPEACSPLHRGQSAANPWIVVSEENCHRSFSLTFS